VVAGVVLMIASYLAARLIKSRPWFFVGWFWYLGTLIPVIGLVQVGGQAMADRYAYIPFIGLYIIVAWWLDVLMARLPQKKLLRVLPHLLIVGVLMVATSHELKFWKNSGTLFKRALEVTQRNYVAHNSLGVYLADHGKEDDAIAQFNKVLEISPSSHRTHYNIGLALVSQQKFEQAIPHFKRSLKLDTAFAASRVKLGYAYYRLGELDQAAENYRIALQIDPENAEAYNHLGLTMVRRRKIKKALAYFRQALRVDPDYAEARYNLEKTQAAFGIKGN
jgi:tetratricopeptide (TPR) repeat protein